VSSILARTLGDGSFYQLAVSSTT